MAKWGWKAGAAFLVALVCATSALVAAGLDEPSDPDRVASIRSSR
jgi:hypothetical protein